jgi:hypothetical protein
MTNVVMEKSGMSDIAVDSSAVTDHINLGWSRKKVEISADGLSLDVPVGTSINVEGAVTGGNLVQAYFVDAESGDDANNGMSWDEAFATIQAAVDAASAGAKVYVAPGAYDETVSVDKALALIGVGTRGSVYIEPSTLGAEGMQVTADDVTLINVGVAGEATADYALRVGSQTASPDRFRAVSCKFEGPTGAVVVLKGAGDALFEDCEFTWGGSGILFDDNDDGFATQIYVQGCRFLNLTDVGVGLAAGGGVQNLHLTDCTFDNAEDGTAPTDYIKVDRSGDTGIVSGCRFATATNNTAVLTIAAGILWVANATEAGWSTARPA